MEYHHLPSAGPAIADASHLWIVASVGVTIGTFVGISLLRRIPETMYRILIGGLRLALSVALFATAMGPVPSR